MELNTKLSNRNLNMLDIGNSLQLSGAIYSGKGKHLVCFFPGELEEDGGGIGLDIFRMNKDEWEVFIKQTDLLETEVIAKEENGTLAKIILRKSLRQIEQGISWRVFKRDGYACRYCNANDVPLTVDHLVCWEVGGPSIEANLVSACRKCNKTRGNTEYSEWLNSPYYAKVSKNLPQEIKIKNSALELTLASIPRMVHKRSR